MTALLVACGEGGPAGGITEHEVDGVVYVDHPGIHVADTTSWRFDAEELFRIGEEDGTEPDVFGSVTGVLSRDDGTVLVADGIANELRHFDQSGRLLSRVGRSGEGPGEFAGVQGLLALPGDSVLTVDRGRLSLFAPDLEFVRTVDPRPEETVGGEPASLRVVSTFADGDLLMSEFLNVCGSARWDGFCDDSVAFVRTDMDGRIEARFGRFVYHRQENHPGPGGVLIGWTEPHPQAFWTSHGDRFYYADAQRFEIQVFGGDGELERVIRVAGDAPRYERDVAMTSPSEGADEELLQALRTAQQEADLPDLFPWFSDLRVSKDGSVWVREYVPPGLADERVPRWFVFDPDGYLRYALESPAGLVRSVRPYTYLAPQIGTEMAVGVVRDDLGVESVVGYALVKR